MAIRTSLESDIIEVNGTKIYYETRGSGPSVIFVSGATGDAGHFTQVAELRAEEFTVITYDRRGNSRSPRPEGWTQTSTDEQGDDAAGLIVNLDLASAVLVGTSGGAIIGLNVILRHEDLLRGAILHEPSLMSILERPDEAMAVLEPVVEQGIAQGGPRGALEAFLDFAAGDALKQIDETTLERITRESGFHIVALPTLRRRLQRGGLLDASAKSLPVTPEGGDSFTTQKTAASRPRRRSSAMSKC